MFSRTPEDKVSTLMGTFFAQLMMWKIQGLRLECTLKCRSKQIFVFLQTWSHSALGLHGRGKDLQQNRVSRISASGSSASRPYDLLSADFSLVGTVKVSDSPRRVCGPVRLFPSRQPKNLSERAAAAWRRMARQTAVPETWPGNSVSRPRVATWNGCMVSRWTSLSVRMHLSFFERR